MRRPLGGRTWAVLAVCLAAVAMAAGGGEMQLPDLPDLTANGADGKPKAMQALNKFKKGQYCDLAVGANGMLHAVYTDQPDAMKPEYLYYRSSTDGGQSWSEPKNLSDDESGNSSGYGRVIEDGQGRVYAIWKYVSKNELIDGPGGNGNGILAFRCLIGGAWSRITRVSPPKLPAYSWYTAPGPGGTVMLVWSQEHPDTARFQNWCASSYANWVQQGVLDGAAITQVKALITPEPLATEAEIEALKKQGKSAPYDRMRSKQEGLINIRGYFDANGTAHFVAEMPPPADAHGNNEGGRRIVLWNGAKLVTLYTYEKFKTYNNFNDPPVLLLDAKGKEHLVRSPEKAEVSCVRDYPIEDGQLGDPVAVVEAPDGHGSVSHWQAMSLPGGRMVATVAMSQKGGYNPDDVELYISFSNGDGQWSKPLCVTENAVRQKIMVKVVNQAGKAVSLINTYSPRIAAVGMGKDGHPVVLMVNIEHSLIGVTGTGGSGEANPNGRGGMGTGGDFSTSVDNPLVQFIRL